MALGPKRFRRLSSLVFAVLAAGTLHAAGVPAKKKAEAEVNVKIDLTDEGRKIARPTPLKPAYYVPTIVGYSEHGEIVAGEIPPGRARILRELAQALAKEGYVLQALRPDADKTVPSLVLVFEWGSLNPQTVDFGGDPTVTPADSSTEAPRVVGDFNQREMLTLIAGDAIYRGAAFTTSEWERLRDAVAEGRYYIIVSAFDFAASRLGVKTLLWRARLSTERQGVQMDDVVSALITSGAPFFGREMLIPHVATVPLREGTVLIGTPITLGQIAEPSPKPKAAPAAKR